MEGTLGEIRMFGGNFAPRAWMFCQGQLLAISQYDALFTIVGTTYGGDGQTTFGLPDLRGRVAVHAGVGAGPGLSSRTLGEMAGAPTVTLTVANLPAHSHPLTGSAGILVSSQDGHTPVAAANFPAINGDMIYSDATDNSAMAPATLNLSLSPSGNGAPFSNEKPYMAINYIICVEGIYPSRN